MCWPHIMHAHMFVLHSRPTTSVTVTSFDEVSACECVDLYVKQNNTLLYVQSILLVSVACAYAHSLFKG